MNNSLIVKIAPKRLPRVCIAYHARNSPRPEIGRKLADGVPRVERRGAGLPHQHVEDRARRSFS